MLEATLYQKEIPSRTYRRRDEEEGALEITAPTHRPKSYRGKVRFGFVVYSINEKHALRALGKRSIIPDGVADREPPGLIDFDWRNWDIFDYVSACGIVLIVIGFVAAIFPSFRSGGALFPIGLGLMTLATYGARRRDTHST